MVDRSRRRKAIRTRWLDLGLMALVGASFALSAPPFSHWWYPRIVSIPCWSLIPGVVVLGVFLDKASRGRRLAFLGLRHPWTYPPVWFSGAWGVGIFSIGLAEVEILHEQLKDAAELSSGLLAVGIGAIGLPFLTALLAWVSRGAAGARPVELSTPAGTDLSSFEKIRAWIEDDRPIVDASGDLFGLRSVARRVAKRLATERAASHAILGDLGTGKTSLLNLVTSLLPTIDGGSKVRIVKVELWQYESARAAVEGAIRAIVDAVAVEVPVVSIQSLPGRYVRAMSALGGWGEGLAHALGPETDPFATLKELDAIALALDVRFVVWVEDLERFAGEGGSAKEHERLNPIRALFHALDSHLEQFSVVVATTSLVSRIEVEKIARFTERIPLLDPEEAVRILRLFRTGCMKLYPNDIDPATEDGRGRLPQLIPGDQPIRVTRRIGAFDSGRLLGLILSGAKKPRQFKFTLRATLDAWTRLHGEVDFDDLLVLSALRHGNPSHYALIEKHMPRIIRRWASDEEREKAKLALQREAEEISLSSPQDVRAVIDYLVSPDAARQSPQGFSLEKYWNRYASLDLAEGDVLDQPVLEALLRGDEEEILDLLEGATREQVVHFESLIEAGQVSRLLVLLVARRSEESSAHWLDGENLFHTVPGLSPLWSIWKRRKREGTFLTDGDWIANVRTALDLAIPVNLFLAMEIEHYFVISSEDVLADRGLLAEAKARTRQGIVRGYVDQPQKLRDALDGAPEATLLWVCWGLDRVREGTTSGLPFEGWPELANTILAAAGIHPEAMMPQVATMIVDAKRDRRGHDVRSFNGEGADNLFGGRETVFELVRKLPPGPWQHHNSVECLLVAAGVLEAPPQSDEPDAEVD